MLTQPNKNDVVGIPSKDEWQVNSNNKQGLKVGELVRIKKNCVGKHDSWMIRYAADNEIPLVVTELNMFDAQLWFAVKPEWLKQPRHYRRRLDYRRLTNKL